MTMLEIDSRGVRRARTRSLISLGGLIKKSGLLKTFQIELGLDLQKDVTMKEQIAALYKGLLVLKDSGIRSDKLTNMAVQGLEEFAKKSETYKNSAN